MKSFYVEAVVGKDNLASQRVASKIISDVPVAGTDSESGEPILAYTTSRMLIRKTPMNETLVAQANDYLNNTSWVALGLIKCC